MKINDWLSATTTELKNAGIESARLDCLVLLEDALGRDRAHILAHLDADIGRKTGVKLNKKIIQRTAHTPLAYIRGKAPFYGRDLVVNEHVLVPRPESEVMIDLLKTLPLPSNPHIADIGSGSGCLGITAALEIPNAKVDLYDISPDALKIARKNALAHQVDVHFCQADLLERTRDSYIVALANLPYVPDSFPVNRAASHEPRLALFAGKDGLDLYRRFWRQLGSLDSAPTYVLTESLPQQHSALQTIALDAGYKLTASEGFIQLFTKS